MFAFNHPFTMISKCDRQNKASAFVDYFSLRTSFKFLITDCMVDIFRIVNIQIESNIVLIV